MTQLTAIEFNGIERNIVAAEKKRSAYMTISTRDARALYDGAVKLAEAMERIAVLEANSTENER